VKRTITLIVIAVVVLAATFAIIKFEPFHKEEKLAETRSMTVDVGSVSLTLPAEGVIEPQSEVLILSPESSIIKSIEKEVGSRVDAGDAIIILDPSPIQERIERIQDQLEMKRNSLYRNQLNARSIRVDLQNNVEVKKLKIASLKSKLESEEKLLEVGGISPAKYEQTQQELALAENDLVTVTEKNAIRLELLEIDEKGLKLEISVQEKELLNLEEQLRQMIIRAPSAGIILSMNGRPGEKVNRDQLLVMMSDLSKFKIKAKSSDEYSEYIRTGRQVLIKLDTEELIGQVGMVSPSIRDNKVEFDVNLERSSHWKLRPNMNLPLRVIIDRADSVTRVRFDQSFSRDEHLTVFRVENTVGKKVEVEFGLWGDEFVELKSGVENGDQLVLTNDPENENKDQISLN
jgi:HlyD family secretion protein